MSRVSKSSGKFEVHAVPSSSRSSGSSPKNLSYKCRRSSRPLWKTRGTRALRKASTTCVACDGGSRCAGLLSSSMLASLVYRCAFSKNALKSKPCERRKRSDWRSAAKIRRSCGQRLNSQLRSSHAPLLLLLRAQHTPSCRGRNCGMLSTHFWKYSSKESNRRSRSVLRKRPENSRSRATKSATSMSATHCATAAPGASSAPPPIGRQDAHTKA
mmetsp:Transcript_57978/g.186221  ORF Transcript_57978/g.186221 Transcript_57978/m.186221 type:complete len:214 (+) Transcript_57978:708-1349(+)